MIKHKYYFLFFFFFFIKWIKLVSFYSFEKVNLLKAVIGEELKIYGLLFYHSSLIWVSCLGCAIRRIIFCPIGEIKGHNDTPFIRIDFHIDPHGFTVSSLILTDQGILSPKFRYPKPVTMQKVISKISVDMVFSFS